VLDEKNIKESIPSVFIDRDFTTKKSEVGQSRGFGFVDFTHHVHALACLRQLNNNPKYSIEYVTSGKKGNAAAKELASGEAGGGRKAPRLIVDFTVENKAKAKKQAEHRAQQQANREAQKLEHKAKTAESKGEKKQSRGALQREKKRKAKDEIVVVKPVAKVRAVPKAPVQAAAPKVKLVKPPKKRKLDSEEQTFERLVQSYTESFSSTIKTADDEEQANVKPKKSEKRWFE
jgi:nucleolar protein 4